MEKYGQLIIKDIKYLQSKLKKSMSERNFDLYARDLCTLYELARDLNVSITKPEVFRKRSIYRADQVHERSIIRNFSESIDFIDEYLKNIHLFDHRKYEKILEQDETDQSFELAIDFLRNNDIELLRELKRISEEEKILIINKRMHAGDGVTYESLNTFSPYVLLADSNYIDIAHELVHELAHSAVSMSRRNLKKDVVLNCKANGLDEVYPHFINILFDDYLKDTDQSISSKVFMNSIKLNYIMSLEDIKDLLDQEQVDLYEYIKKISYAFGLAIAYIFFDRYKIDKIEALKELKEFMRNIEKTTLIRTIEKANLDKDLLDKKVLLKYI